MKMLVAILAGALLAALFQRGYADVTVRWVPVELKISCIKSKGRLCTPEEAIVELGLRSDGSIAGWRPHAP